MFHHPNPDIARWWRGRFFANVSEVAAHSGLTEVAVYDPDENIVAQGVLGLDWEKDWA